MDTKLSIIDICYANTAQIPKTLMFFFYFINKNLITMRKFKNWPKVGEECTPYRYRSFGWSIDNSLVIQMYNETLWNKNTRL